MDVVAVDAAWRCVVVFSLEAVYLLLRDVSLNRLRTLETSRCPTHGVVSSARWFAGETGKTTRRRGWMRSRRTWQSLRSGTLVRLRRFCSIKKPSVDDTYTRTDALRPDETWSPLRFAVRAPAE